MLYNFVFLPSVWYDLIISVLLLLPPALVAQDTARFIGLGHLPGGSSSMAFDVSANGLVVVGRDGGVGSVGIGFRWTEEGGITELPFFQMQHKVMHEVSQGMARLSLDMRYLVMVASRHCVGLEARFRLYHHCQ